jgi:hypothetical protein
MPPLQPSTAYGDGAAPAVPSASAAQAEPSATAALFSLAATPEPQNHGAFLAQLLARHGSSLVVLIDASGMRQRLTVAGGDAGRLGQRTALWQDFCGHYGASATVVDLLADPSASVTANTKTATAPTTPATAATATTATTATGGGAS